MILELTLKLYSHENGGTWSVVEPIPGFVVVEVLDFMLDGIPHVTLRLAPEKPQTYKVINPLGASVRSMAFERGGYQGWLAPGAKVKATGPLQYVDGNQWLPITYPKQPAYVAVHFNGKDKLVPVQEV